jgi:hypothetical protein
MKQAVFLFVTGLLFLGRCGGAGRPSADVALQDEVARKVRATLEAQDFAGTASTFCFPDQTRVRDEEAWLGSSLLLLRDRFGRADSFTSYRGVPNAHFAAIGAGSTDFWSKHEEATRYTFEVHFERRGRGWIFVDVTQACGSPQVKAIMYALPTEAPGAKAFVDGVVQELTRSLPADAKP